VNEISFRSEPRIAVNTQLSTVGQLAMKTEAEMLKYRNFGKKSLNEN